MLLGRRAERARIDLLLNDARDGRSGCLVLTGDPGIGKSTLLDYARAGAQGMTLLSCRGYEAESRIPFAGLSDVLRPALPLLDRLPGPQAAALQSALSIGPPVPGDRFSVCAATLGILAAAAEDEPLLVLVDDVHWLDGSSREALLFAARRLHAEHVAMLLASRPVADADAALAGVARLPLGALDESEAAPLLAELVPAASADVRHRIYRAAAGNPLGIEELSHQWSSAAPSFPEPGIAPDSRLSRAIGGRLDGLPEPTHTALMLVAASPGGQADVVLRAARLAGLSLADFAPAEEAGLLVIEDGRAAFRHPLLRSVVYGAATTHARSLAHAALAEALADVPDDAAADARAWHLAVARLPTDAETARLLAEAGTRARRRGGHGEAARAFEQAARFSEPPERPAILVRAARSWQLAGRSGRVLALLEEALPLVDDPRLRGLVRHMDAYVRTWRRTPDEGLARMISGAEDVEPFDVERAALMNADTAIACFMLGRIHLGMERVRRAHELGVRCGGVAELVSAVALATGEATQGRRAQARRLLADHADELDACDPLSRAQELAHAAFVAIWLEDYPQAERWLDRASRAARQLGAIGVLPQVLAMEAELYFRTGRWAESRAAAAESLSLAAESGEPDLYSRLFVARLDGLQGRVAECRAGLEHIRRTTRRLGVEGLAPYVGHLDGMVALGRGDVERAMHRLEAVRRLPMVRETPEQGVVPWGYDLVEAYARAGRTAEARALLDEITPAPDDAEHRWAHAVAARCLGLLGSGAAGDAQFRRALELHEGVGQPFERARTLLCFGERLRRERHRAAAREHLRTAAGVFDRLGATAWAERARTELVATGETLSHGTGPAALLTPQELQVATVVARGASNAEAASALFLSPKTIEYHLSNIYRKTHLGSRAKLAVLVGAAG